MRCSDPSAADVIVLGGGPAGCAAALALRRENYSVVLIDWPRRSTSVMGETLAPETVSLLTQIDDPQLLHNVPCVQSPGIVSSWDDGPAVEIDYIFNPHGLGLHVERDQLHAALLAEPCRAGVNLVAAKLQSCRRTLHGRWSFTARTAISVVERVGRWVVDATGRTSWFVARQGVAFLEADRLVALVDRSLGDDMCDPRLELRSAPNGWWYRIPLPNGGGLSALLTDHDLLPRGRQAILEFWNSELPEPWRVKQSVARVECTGRLLCIPASTRWALSVTGPNWIVAGDAAVAVDALCGQGVALAVESGREAARTIVSHDLGNLSALPAYVAWTDARRTSLRQKQSQLYAAVVNWRDRPFWKRRNRSHRNLPAKLNQ